MSTSLKDRVQPLATAAVLLVLASATGCQSLITSVNGIPSVPVQRVPGQFLAEKRSDYQQISMLRLRQDPPKVYRLGPGDVLGVYIETVLGQAEEAPPVHFPEDDSQPPAIGFPTPVREDGTLSLPYVPPILVSGKTLNEAVRAIREEYLVKRQILAPDKSRVIVTLMKRRSSRILVVREESGGVDGVTKEGTGYAVDLPAYENDLLHALNETGGLPGLDAKNEILIYRGAFKSGQERDELVAAIRQTPTDPCQCLPSLPDDPNVVSIPIRYHPTRPPSFSEKDIILNEGDIVFIQSRDQEKFYTGGLLPGGEHLVPRDYDLDIMGAIAIAGGQIGSGGVVPTGQGTGFTGSGGGYTGCPPSRAIVLRKTPCNGQIAIRVDLNKALMNPRERILIQPGDVIIVQYTHFEELTNLALSLIRFNFLFSGFSGNGI